jgi:hypothetical protein
VLDLAGRYWAVGVAAPGAWRAMLLLLLGQRCCCVCLVGAAASSTWRALLLLCASVGTAAASAPWPALLLGDRSRTQCRPAAGTSRVIDRLLGRLLVGAIGAIDQRGEQLPAIDREEGHEEGSDPGVF